MNHISALPIGSKLNSYKIESILGQGGFGITYKAWHEALEEFVAIKEFFPATLAARSQVTVGPHSSSNQKMFDESLKRFFDEGRILVKLKHPNIVRCRDLFRTNGTAYLVMDYEDGLPLSTLLNTMKQQGKTYNQEQLLHFLIPLAEGLAYMHDRGVLHRDIKPDNIFIRRQDGSPVIIDFGAAKQNYAEVSQSKAPYTEFYAPIEQIEGECGVTAKPTIDIHAFGGVMYKAITGEVGPKAESRAMALAFGKPDPLKPIIPEKYTDFDNQVLELVNQSLAFKAEDRPIDMRNVLERLSYVKEPRLYKNRREKEQAEHSIQRVEKVRSSESASSVHLTESSEKTDSVKSNQFIPSADFAVSLSNDSRRFSIYEKGNDIVVVDSYDKQRGDVIRKLHYNNYKLAGFVTAKSEGEATSYARSKSKYKLKSLCSKAKLNSLKVAESKNINKSKPYHPDEIGMVKGLYLMFSFLFKVAFVSLGVLYVIWFWYFK
ncbi:serine/threonine protein kinase [Vibrio chaetopteri]|uniref:serine/threonine protein kinase n=1 Tax=Vibrio chaetopteri TaxID=3016528 RepID=UPI003AB43ADB